MWDTISDKGKNKYQAGRISYPRGWRGSLKVELYKSDLSTNEKYVKLEGFIIQLLSQNILYHHTDHERPGSPYSASYGKEAAYFQKLEETTIRWRGPRGMRLLPLKEKRGIKY